MKVSIVIPTYNRGSRLEPTLRALLSCKSDGLEEIQITVVDDGSPVAARPVVEAVTATGIFDLQCLRQENAGPAAARNTGFRASRGDIVIFIDDDILVPPELILQHVEAHRANPRSVICGRCPFVELEQPTSLFRFITALDHDFGKDAAEEFVAIEVVASGQISVEREMFNVQEGVYRDDLATPAAEEFELSMRLRQEGIAILLATRIVALHDHPLNIASLCRQQYKHAVGCAEAAIKYPSTRGINSLDNIIAVNGLHAPTGSLTQRLKWAAKRSFSARFSRAFLLSLAQIIERLAAQDRLLAPVYRAVMGMHFFAGVRDGLRRFGSQNGTPVC